MNNIVPLHASYRAEPQFEPNDLFNTFNHALIGMALMDLDGILLLANPAYCNLIGYTSDELKSLTLMDVVHSDDAQHDLNLRERLVTGTQASYRREKRYLHRSGRVIWGDYSCTLVRDKKGQAKYFIGQVLDITAQKEADHEVTRLNEALEAKVLERTRELERANAELEALAYSIAHDLRGPMTSLAGFSRILEQNLGELDPTNARYFGRIKSNVKHMSELTDALLSLARLSRVALNGEVVDLAAVARDIVTGLSQQEPQRRLNFGVDGPLEVRGDPRLLRQVMTNLLANAWKFSSTCDETSIRVSADGSVAGEVIVSVRDSGVGFDMAYVSQLFSPFARLHTQGEFEGTGIGLALVRNIVQRHGGRVWANSAPGAGATFSFSLPA